MIASMDLPSKRDFEDLLHSTNLFGSHHSTQLSKLDFQSQIGRAVE